MGRNEKIDYFMNMAECCKSPDDLAYGTQGGDCTIEAAKYIESLEKTVLMLQWQIGDILEKDLSVKAKSLLDELIDHALGGENMTRNAIADATWSIYPKDVVLELRNYIGY